jgi:4-amino-4-deoxy-L-arabinose transferase-like glycosyltransferase
MSGGLLPLLLLFLLALSMRTFRLTELPPGLTHDEANHGREARGILDGVYLFYFPLNYGSEPLFSYSAAGSMLLLGENLLALRMVNVVASLGAIAATYFWVSRAFDRRTAMLAVALMTVSFWPIASSRQALRAGLLPLFQTLAVAIFWRLAQVGQDGASPASETSRRVRAWLTVLFAFTVATTFHIYLAARVAWLMYPSFAIYLAAGHRRTFRQVWLPILVGLLLAGLLVLPMFNYLENHPEAQTRLGMLTGPLEELRRGELQPLLKNSAEALLSFVRSGYGDNFLAYNIPGRPLFDVISSFFFVTGIVFCLWRWKRPPYALLLLWFICGISPSLVTGPTANSTRNLAALPAIYILPSVGFVGMAKLLGPELKKLAGWSRLPWMNHVTPAIAALWILFAGLTSVRDYFLEWGESAEVRGAYQHTLVEMLSFLESEPGGEPVVISSVYPGPVHDPSIALIMLPEPSFEMRWVDARSAFILPGGQGTRALVPSSTPLHPAFHGLLDLVDVVTLRPDDLDPRFGTYRVGDALPNQWLLDDPVEFGGSLSLLHSQWLSPSSKPGTTAELLSVWRVLDPSRIGPIVPPAQTSDVVLFTHVLDEEGGILAQSDALDAPSWDWQAGDIVLQIHAISIAQGIEQGSYETIVGVYDRLSGDRLPVVTRDGISRDSWAAISPLQIIIH